MKLKKPQRAEVDLEGPGLVDSNVFGLNFTAEESSIVLLPVPWEPTVSYGSGTSRGPEHIRRASPQIDLFDGDLARYGLGHPWEYGVHWLTEAPEVRELNAEACRIARPIVAALESGRPKAEVDDALAQVNRLSQRLNLWVREQVSAWQERGKIVGLIGGEHSVSFGAIAACAERFPELGVLHIDAHADLRQAYEGFEYSHASVMHNAISRLPGLSRLVQVGVRDLCVQEAQLSETEPRIRTWYDWDLRDARCAGTSFAEMTGRILADLPANVYVSFDIDGLEPALCPSTGTPVPGGLSFGEACFLLRELARSGRRIVGFDVVEVAPPAHGEWDGNVGARILYKLVGSTLLSHGVPDST